MEGEGVTDCNAGWGVEVDGEPTSSSTFTVDSDGCPQ